MDVSHGLSIGQNGLRNGGRAGYPSIMCSIEVGSPEGSAGEGQAGERIAEIERAIDDLANRARPDEAGGTEPIVARVAELWGLLAELDPEVARRLAGYQALSAVPTPAELAGELAPRWHEVGVIAPTAGRRGGSRWGAAPTSCRSGACGPRPGAGRAGSARA